MVLVSHLLFTGAQWEMELQVRLFFRRVFLNHSCLKTEKAFWLNLVLKPFPLVHQARLLFLLYGPTCAGQLRLILLLVLPGCQTQFLVYGNTTFKIVKF